MNSDVWTSKFLGIWFQTKVLTAADEPAYLRRHDAAQHPWPLCPEPTYVGGRQAASRQRPPSY